MQGSSRLAAYETLKLLGQGNYGSVYKVRKVASNTVFVIKRIAVSGLDRWEQQDVEKEAKLMERLNSPYLVKYFESFIEEEHLHIVMEFCERGDLSHFIDRQAGQLVPETTIWKYFIQMCLGLECLHSQKILHRDIKPMNIFLAKDDSVRIADLGVAKVLTHTGAYANTLVGTPYYLSPELCQEQPYNEKSDIWALGCVLYELCTLKHPFEAKTQCALFLKIMQSSFQPINPSYSSDLKSVLSQMLLKDPGRRPTVEEILLRPKVKELATTLQVQVPARSVLAGRRIPFQFKAKPETRPENHLPVRIKERTRAVQKAPPQPETEGSYTSSDSDQPIPTADPVLFESPNEVEPQPEAGGHPEALREVLGTLEQREVELNALLTSEQARLIKQLGSSVYWTVLDFLKSKVQTESEIDEFAVHEITTFLNTTLGDAQKQVFPAMQAILRIELELEKLQEELQVMRYRLL